MSAVGNGQAWPRQAVAIVGVGCRLPGGIRDLDGLWRALLRGDDLVGTVPPDRFEAERYVDESVPRADRSYTRAGGFLGDVTGFDAAYFGISPKEAASMDPQQRLLLEMTAEALDDAGIDPARLAGTATGVFVGVSDLSYGVLQALEPGAVGPYSMSGMALSITANRLSYAFDLRGPSMAIDTACSSSLQAVERACRALADGSARTALAGGVNVLLSPMGFVGFSQASMLSPTGRCRAFSADADGFVRSEGGGVVVLKPLADALADGDRIHGVIVGAAANNDGRTMGLALPRTETQEELLRQVYREAGISPDELVYVEAHGTGTQAGDPAEAGALGRALGMTRSGGPLPIGSVKTNVGHLEPASGMPGLFKALLVLRHRTIPPSLHASTLNPAIDFDGLGLDVVRSSRPLPETAGRAVVGVNSFGFGGANVHVALAAPPPQAAPPRPVEAAPVPVVVSARSSAALPEAVARAAAHLASVDESDFYDVAYTATRRRGRHRHRAVVLASSAADAAATLSSLYETAPESPPVPDDPTPTTEPSGLGDPTNPDPATEEPPASGGPADPTPTTDLRLSGDAGLGPGVGWGPVVGEEVERGRVALVFCGNGSQWAGMGADLLGEPAFRKAVEAVDDELTARLGWSVLEELTVPPDRWRLEATERAQPLLFAVQVGLAGMLEAAGVRAGAVLGHSVGEVAAAYVCGALSAAQAARVVAARGLAQAPTRGLGGMAAVGLPEAEARHILAAYPGVEVAAVNTGQDVTVAGPRASLERLAAGLAARGVFCRELDVDYPFHSSAMEVACEPLDAALAGLRPSRARIPMVSTVTGEPLTGDELDAAYWWRNLRRPVRFAAAMERVLADGFDVLVEVGPHPVLRPYVRRVAAAARVRTAIVATLRRPDDTDETTTPRKTDGTAAVGAAVAAVIAAGGEVDWERYFPRPGLVRSLPAYPWQRQRHWVGGPLSWARTIGDPKITHPLLGQRLPTLDPAWHGELDPVLVPWVTDHRAGGAAVMPATGYVEMALAAGRQAIPEADEAVEVDRASITRALVVPGPGAEQLCVQTSLSAETGTITVASTTRGGQHPREHFRARVRALLRPAPAPLDLAELRARVAEPVDVPAYYARAAEGRMVWGPAFQVLTGLWRAPGEVLGSYRCPGQEDEHYQAHPVLLDSALQAGVLWLVDALVDGTAYMPAAIGAVRVWGRPDAEGFLHVRERSSHGAEVCWDITVTGADGRVTAEMTGVRLRRTPGVHTTRAERYHVELRAAPRPGEPAGPWPGPDPATVLAGASGRLAEVRSAWRELRYPAYAALLEKTFARALGAALAERNAPPSDTEQTGGRAESYPDHAERTSDCAEPRPSNTERTSGRAEPHGGAELTVDELVGLCREPHHRALVRAALPLMERHGVVERRGEAVRLMPVSSAAAELRELAEAGTAFPAQTALAVRAGLRLGEALAGDTGSEKAGSRGTAADISGGTDVDTPGPDGTGRKGTGSDGAAELLDQYHDIGPTSLYANRLARALVERIAAEWPDDRPLRVLEVGAGTGGTTVSLLPVLPADRVHYTVTDVAEPVLARLRQRLSGVDVAEFGLLDLDADPVGQGYPAGGFDLVVAAGCLHLAGDLPGALRGLRRLLAPGGQLLVAGPHRADPLLPFLVLTPQFWCAGGPDALPSARRWPELLAEAGYAGVVQTGPEEEPEAGDFAVLLATSPSPPPAQPVTEPATSARAAAAEHSTDPAGDNGDRVAAKAQSLVPEDGADPAATSARSVAAEDSTDPVAAKAQSVGVEDGADPVSGAWVVVAEDGEDSVAAELVSLLRERGGRADLAPLADDPAAWAGLASSADAVTFAVVLGGAEPGDAVERITRRAAALRSIALAAEEMPLDLRVHLWLVARPCGALPEPGSGATRAHTATGVRDAAALGDAGDPEDAAHQENAVRHEDAVRHENAVRQEDPGPCEDAHPDGAFYPEDAATWGTVRSLGNEQPRLDARRVCLHRGGDAREDAARLAAELLSPGEDDEILLTRRGRFAPRLVRTPPPAGHKSAYRLAVRDPGLAYELSWVRAEPPEPGPGQALVEVRAIGLNYRDVMFTVGLLPSEAVEAVFGGHELGLECAGTVVAVGPGVTGLRPGDRVAAAGPVGFGSHAVIDERAAGTVPDGLAFAEAVTLPMVSSTVYHALDRCARLRRGETVLVHGGAGGVGLAALEYARHVGAHVIATAGSEAKRDLLRALGVAHVLDSRSLRFADQVRELTGGRGVDVVLNSLAGEAINRGLECLRHGGRFVELGKRDIYENGHVALRPFGDNIAFFGVDVGTLLWKDPEAATGHTTALQQAHDPRPLPHTVFPAERVADAFALMRHSRHIGKVVVSLDPRDEPITVRSRPARRRPVDGTYLITGGLTGFGAATARHLARGGARRLALVGRRGAQTPGADALLAELGDLGAEATAYAADAADRDAMRDILRELDAAGHPVRGVVHAAMRLDDAALADLSDDRIRAVLRPKVAGALVLDELTAELPLESFVLYSSLTTIGNIGQSPYVSANLFLEALARRRRARGLPALTVCLGALKDTGVLADGTQAEALARFGVDAMDAAVALDAVDDMLADGSDVAVVGRCDWAKLRAALPGLRRPWLSAVLPPGADQAADAGDLLAELAAMSGEEAHERVVALIIGQLSTVLLVPAADIDPDRRLDEYGLDSLMGTQLLLSMRHTFGVDIPPMELIRSAGTVTDIARTVLLHLGLHSTRPVS